MKPSAALMKARELIEPPTRWWDGKGRSEDRPKGTNCATTAIGSVTYGSFISGDPVWAQALAYLEDAAELITPSGERCQGIVHLNDTRGHKAVIEAYQVACSMALYDEAGQ